MDSAIIGFIGVIIGAVVTGGISIYLDHRAEERETKATIKALKSELQALKIIFISEFGSKISQDNNPLIYSYPLDTDYFTIYHSNTCKIGKINNDTLREHIIFIYSTAKFFLDCIRTNNAILEDYSKINEKYSNIPISSRQFDPLYKQDIEPILYRLRVSKTENLLPTYNKLNALFTSFEAID
jgi:hypothetical protein